MYLAHRTEEGREQPLLDHLKGTAKLASAFAAAFGEEKLAYVLGMAHDIGKYSDAFQRYLRANGQGSRVDHATAGAKVLMRRGMLAAAFCAAGHHTGLPDGGARGDLPDSGTILPDAANCTTSPKASSFLTRPRCSRCRTCVRAIGELVQRHHLTAVLCTATQPALEPYFVEIGVQARKICPGTEALYRFFRRTTLSYIGPCTRQMLARKMEAQSQALAIVATRKQAAALFSMLPEEGRFHLSTLMAPVYRTRILETIRSRLKEEKPCRVAATSLVEAGVDVDFPLVFRAEAGLDSIIQAAGLCNREGKRAAADSMVYIYRPEEPPPMLVKQQVELFREMRERFADLAAPEAIHAYFDAVHALGEQSGQLDSKQILRAFDRGRNGSQLPFAQVAQDFKLIETETRSVLIPLEEEAANLAQALRSGACSRGVFRRIGAYTVSVYPQHFQALVAAGDVEVVADGFGVLVNDSLYSEDTGLSLQSDEGKAIFV